MARRSMKHGPRGTLTTSTLNDIEMDGASEHETWDTLTTSTLNPKLVEA